MLYSSRVQVWALFDIDWPILTSLQTPKFVGKHTSVVPTASLEGQFTFLPSLIKP